jgi:serine/threonine protein kinase
MPLTAGTKLDGYEILGLIGAGGMGEVYRTRDAALKREVAIKILPFFVLHDAERLSRFKHEAQGQVAEKRPIVRCAPLGRDRIVCKPSMIRSPSSTLGLDADFVIHRGLNSLFATKISFGCLH